MSLIIGGYESRQVKATIEFEAAVTAALVQGQGPRIDRVRFDDGRWRKVTLLLARLRALGCTVDLSTVQVGQRGDHTPIL